LEDLDIDGRIILKQIFKKLNGETWTGFILLSIWTGGGFCECGNEPPRLIKYGKYFV